MKGNKSLRPGRARRVGTIRARVLAIVLIPSVALLVIGVGASGYLVRQGIKAQDWSIRIQDATSTGFATAVQEERRLTLLRIVGDRADSANLEQQRQVVGSALTRIGPLGATLRDFNPGVLDTPMAQFNQGVAAIAGMRQKIDAGQLGPQEAYAFYNQIIDVVSIGIQGLARTVPDSETAVEESTAADLFQVTDAMSRSNALAAGGVARGGMTPDELLEFWHQVGAYHGMITALLSRMTDHGRAQYASLAGSDAWKKLSAQETALIQKTRLPLALPEWQNVAGQVTVALLDMWQDHQKYAQDFAVAGGKRTFWQSLLAGIGVLLISVLAFLIALRLSGGLINRLKRLRGETLNLADEQLPRIVERLREGRSVDLETEVAILNHGTDEIGQVADAFNKAQQTAVSAAVQEAKTRAGVNAVFLNIAHRSQVVAHRQLEVLDEAERTQEDPDQLELLFKLDHLATRSRRNAENLLILGGTQPGRQWRNPVPLVEVVRSAVGETEEYARVNTGRLPEVSMVGAVVADLVHLLAELVDNATSFSPPESRVEVRGNVVGKGVVVEVEDQGLGIPREGRDRMNEALHEPPDFGVMTLSDDARLGLFVVARLAARHGIGVTLAESPYGGTRAIVLIRANLIATVEEEPVPEPEPEPVEQTAPWPRRTVFEPVVESESTVWPEEEPADKPSAPRHAQPVANHEPQGNGDKPPLPRRRRQANLAPQLASETAVLDQPAANDKSADQARNMMSAFQRGTRQAREDG